jgi:hypothetical protein
MIRSRSSIVARPREGAVTVRQVEDILEIQFFGYVTGSIAESAAAGARKHLADRPSFFVIDTSHATGYSPDVRVPGVALLRALKWDGLVAGFCIAGSASIRMIAAAVAFVAATPVTFVETRMMALAQIDEKRASRDGLS